MGKEKSLMTSERADRYGKTVELKMVEVMLLRTRSEKSEEQDASRQGTRDSRSSDCNYQKLLEL